MSYVLGNPYKLYNKETEVYDKIHSLTSETDTELVFNHIIVPKSKIIKHDPELLGDNPSFWSVRELDGIHTPPRTIRKRKNRQSKKSKKTRKNRK